MNGLRIFRKFNPALMLAILLVPTAAPAKSTVQAADAGQRQRYIVILDDPPLVNYDGRELFTPERQTSVTRLTATANRFTGARKLDVNSSASQQYLKFLDERFESFLGEAALQLGRRPQAIHRYRNASNGFAATLTAAEAALLETMPRVLAVRPDEIQRLNTDSGPAWIGADKIHAGLAGYPPRGGEGMVAGVLDTGINWNHPAFSDPGEGLPASSGRWDHVNPYGSQLGLCAKATVRCNDKLVGVYDFVKDDPDTGVVEENNSGKDNIGHGSLVASVVAGNPGFDFAPLGGVAPNANIISYRVCFLGDPDDGEDDGCQSSAILSAIDQAIDDGVDVVNHSIGGPATDPWSPTSSAYAFLNLRAAGVFVVTSAGNSGPGVETVGSPANAPWIMAVGAATHDRLFSSVLQNMSGGASEPPADLYGESLSGGVGIRKIVHARDYGNALCGTGEAELQPDCASNSGVTSNPFAPGTFNGEIVVCDRGIYGRVEKGKNLLRAGAGGYVLANTADSPQTVVADSHCLPATHIDVQDGDKLRAWLDGGSGHRASISGGTLLHIPELGDVLADFSSRGPNAPYAVNVMKPALIAPGVSILGAAGTGNGYAYGSGTSFSSPHVAGAAALLKSVHPDWTPAMIGSALVMTATPEQAVDYDDSTATLHKRAAGRPRLDLAVNAGLYLEESRAGFLAANPASGGDPGDLNLPGLIDNDCVSCRFERTVTDLVGGASWTVTSSGLADGLSVTVTPASFSLADGASQNLLIEVELTSAAQFGKWLEGEVRLSSAGLPDAVLPLAVFAGRGNLPQQWTINSDKSSGWKTFSLAVDRDMPDATLTAAGFVVPESTTVALPQDPTDDDPYDGLTGVYKTWFHVPEGTLLLHAETLASTARDLDLYVGRDSNGNFAADENEELCASHSPDDIESCDIFAPEPGNYWVIMQNWLATNDTDDATLKTAMVTADNPAGLSASGDGIVPSGKDFELRLSWDNVSATPGTELIGAVGLGTHREHPNNLGVVPVRFNKTGVAQPQTRVLMNGVSRAVTIAAGGTHDRIVVDVPAGVSALTLESAARNGSLSLNSSLGMELYRLDFDDAFGDAPFAAPAATAGSPLASASGSGLGGAKLTLNDVTPGRWYVVLNNAAAMAAEVEIRAEMAFSGEPVAHRSGLWQPSSRPDLRQGIDYASTGDYRALLWYTYGEDGRPVWYLAADPEPSGNVWVSPLLRFTNDGTLQHYSPVGYVSVTTLTETDNIFSFMLYGEEGSDRMFPTSPQTCAPGLAEDPPTFTGIWSRPAVGVGGASVLVNDSAQGYLHYIYDANGSPVWLQAADTLVGLPHTETALMQYSGYCAVCTGDVPTSRAVGVFTMDYVDDQNAGWNLDYLLLPPLSGSVKRSDVVAKLTVPLPCL
jgi:subtilisin family serine protease